MIEQLSAQHVMCSLVKNSKPTKSEKRNQLMSFISRMFTSGLAVVGKTLINELIMNLNCYNDSFHQSNLSSDDERRLMNVNHKPVQNIASSKFKTYSTFEDLCLYHTALPTLPIHDCVKKYGTQYTYAHMVHNYAIPNCLYAIESREHSESRTL